MASTLQSAQQDENKVNMNIMIDSGAATHVCPPWFAPNTPMYNLEHGQGPQLRTATDENIPVYGYKWVLVTSVNKQQLVVPLFAREVTTHPVSNKTGRTRVQHTTEWDTNSQTVRDSTQHLFNVMDSTSWQWSLSTFQSTCNWKYIKRPKAQQQRSHQSPWHQQVWRSWGTEMTSGHSTTKDIWSVCTEHNTKHSLCQTNGVQFQQQGWRTTEEQL